MSLHPPKQYISHYLLAAIMSLFAGKETVGESNQLGRLCEEYGLDEYFSIERDKDGFWHFSLADSSPQKSPLWKMLDKYVSDYQKDVLDCSDILEGRECFHHPINVAPFDVSIEETRKYLSQAQQKYGNRFCIDFFEKKLPSHIRWLECIWILRKNGELKFERGHIHLTDKFVPADIDPYSATEEVAARISPNKTDLSCFRIKDGYITCRGQILKFTKNKKNDEKFKILRVLLQKNRKVKYEEIWKDVKDAKNKNLKDLKGYMKDNASRIRKVVKKFGYNIVNKTGYMQIIKEQK